MSFKLRHLHLRAQTAQGLFGTKIQFNDGLVLLRAENTMGKSTCIQAIIYALGLEKMLGPSSSIPLPHVMTEYLDGGNGDLKVLESEVLLEVENSRGEAMTIQRSVVGNRDTRLVSTWGGGLISSPGANYRQRDYFVRDPGAAQNEAGFSRKLADFIGWQLPTVRKFNGSECPLYLETIFPLFIVEQKHGWSGIQANLPTYFGIRDMAKRCLEFVLNLDAARLAEERQNLEHEESEIRSRWKNLSDLLFTRIKDVNGRIVGMSEQPSAQWPLSTPPTIEVFRGGAWIGLQAALANDIAELQQLEQVPVPTAGKDSESARAELAKTQKILSERELVAGELLEDIQREQLQLRSTEIRLSSLREDLRRNKDSLKLRGFGSNAGWRVIEHVCPTCQQHLSDTLLPQGPAENPMSVEENIKFIENQIKTFDHLRENAATLIGRKESEFASFRSEIENLRGQIRSIRQTLLSPASTPSLEAVRKRVDLEGRIRTLQRAEAEFGESMESFSEVALLWRSILDRRKNLPKDGFSSTDKNKLTRLEVLFKEQLIEFGFRSLDASALNISADTYRPSREGFDLGFDLSASDNVRTIWAFLQGLLELSAEQQMNHLGLLMFDEPRQQEAAEMSFERLLARAAKSIQRGQQVIFATSEPLENIQRLTANLNPQIVSFQGRVVARLQ